jgi:hypothetical protein
MEKEWCSPEEEESTDKEYAIYWVISKQNFKKYAYLVS